MAVHARALALRIPRLDAPLAAFVLALAVLAVCLGAPTASFPHSIYRHLIVFDVSQSMNVADVPQPGRTRLEHAKASAIEAMTALPCGSEVGIGLFAGHRTLVLFTPVEICAHYGDIATTVRSIDWRMAWVARSEVAKGVHSSLKAARTLHRRISVIFLTDGHEAPPLHPAHRPRYDGVPGEIPGAIAGVGGLVPRPIPKLDMNGKTKGFWHADEVMQVDPFSLGRPTSASNERLEGIDTADVDARIAAGREHLSSLKENYLRDLAARLSLHYARIESAKDLRRLLLHPQLAIERTTEADLRPLLGGLALVLIACGYAAGAGRMRGRRSQIKSPFLPTKGTP